jgi:large subunit ribosomal protein L9
MKIILKENVEKLGHKDDLVTVKNGYARNFLIPQGFAVQATESVKKIHAENVRQRAHKEEKLRNEAMGLAKFLENKVLRIGAKTSTTGKIFGSVNTIQLAEAIAEKGFVIDRKNITILTDESIKEVGTYKAKIRLHKDVSVEMNFEVFAE